MSGIYVPDDPEEALRVYDSILKSSPESVELNDKYRGAMLRVHGLVPGFLAKVDDIERDMRYVIGRMRPCHAII